MGIQNAHHALLNSDNGKNIYKYYAWKNVTSSFLYLRITMRRSKMATPDQSPSPHARWCTLNLQRGTLNTWHPDDVLWRTGVTRYPPRSGSDLRLRLPGSLTAHPGWTLPLLPTAGHPCAAGLCNWNTGRWVSTAKRRINDNYREWKWCVYLASWAWIFLNWVFHCRYLYIYIYLTAWLTPTSLTMPFLKKPYVHTQKLPIIQ